MVRTPPRSRRRAVHSDRIFDEQRTHGKTDLRSTATSLLYRPGRLPQGAPHDKSDAVQPSPAQFGARPLAHTNCRAYVSPSCLSIRCFAPHPPRRVGRVSDRRSSAEPTGRAKYRSWRNRRSRAGSTWSQGNRTVSIMPSNAGRSSSISSSGARRKNMITPLGLSTRTMYSTCVRPPALKRAA